MNREQILQEADRCVKCGLCLPTCPTYRLTRHEGDSPRGRITLIQARASGSIDNRRLHQHLERCLLCLACERACPSGVNYSALATDARDLYGKCRPATERLLRFAVTRGPYLPWGPSLVRLYQVSGLRTLARGLLGRRFRRLDTLLPEIPKPAPLASDRSNLPVKPLMRVGLFTGCIGRISGQRAISAAVRLLRRLGIEVIIPPTQGCCGAMHQHGGAVATARDMAKKNLQAFNDQKLDAMIHLASGCGTQLAAYPILGKKLDLPVVEICRFLLEHRLIDAARLRHSQANLVLHTPCSLQDDDAASILLHQIPGLAISPLQGLGCCGAAGSYLINQPEMSDRLRLPMLDQLVKIRPDLLATSNTGCALHLGAGIRNLGLDTTVIHPVELIERQMEQAGS